MTSTSHKELKIWLVRHGEKVDHDHESDITPPLTERGHHQARLLAGRLRNTHFDHCYTSDMVRAQQTAEPVLAALPHTPHRIDPRLREVDYFHTHREFTTSDPAILKQIADERKRTDSFAAELVTNHHHGEQILLICHGNIIRLLAAIWSKSDPRTTTPFLTDHTSITTLQYRSGGHAFWNAAAVFEIVNCTAHLRDPATAE